MRVASTRTTGCTWLTLLPRACRPVFPLFTRFGPGCATTVYPISLSTPIITSCLSAKPTALRFVCLAPEGSEKVSFFRHRIERWLDRAAELALGAGEQAMNSTYTWCRRLLLLPWVFASLQRATLRSPTIALKCQRRVCHIAFYLFEWLMAFLHRM